MKSIGILTSGGDSPGMNCAIRAVVRTALGHHIKVFGIQRGYEGLINNQMKELDVSSVGNIIHTGGTILQTSRCRDFRNAQGRKQAYETLKSNNIDGLVILGGNGSFQGAKIFSEEYDIPVVGIPATIDNDISSTEYTIGFDTAVQTAIDAVDKIRDTASSHERTFIVEVMGRKSPAIAVHVGVCCGAENIVFPTKDLDSNRIAADINRGIKRGKTSSIIIVGEGERAGLSYEVQKELESKHKINAHVCILGHIQRGGRPTHHDRFIGSKMGNQAVKELIRGEKSRAIIYQNGTVSSTGLANCFDTKIDYETPFLELVRSLSH
jgi:6-phosphofructokinase 1